MYFYSLEYSFYNPPLNTPHPYHNQINSWCAIAVQLFRKKWRFKHFSLSGSIPGLRGFRVNILQQSRTWSTSAASGGCEAATFLQCATTSSPSKPHCLIPRVCYLCNVGTLGTYLESSNRSQKAYTYVLGIGRRGGFILKCVHFQ